MKWRKRPIVVDAVQWTGENPGEMSDFAGSCFRQLPMEQRGTDQFWTAEVWDKLHRSWIDLGSTQWIIKGPRGEFYPMDDGVLRETYDEVPEEDLCPRCGSLIQEEWSGVKCSNDKCGWWYCT